MQRDVKLFMLMKIFACLGLEWGKVERRWMGLRVGNGQERCTVGTFQGSDFGYDFASPRFSGGYFIINYIV